MAQTVKMVQAVVLKRNFYMKVFSFNQICHEEFLESIGINTESKEVILTLDSQREELAVLEGKLDIQTIADFVFKVLKREVEFSHFNTSSVVFKEKACGRGEKQEL